MKRKLIEIFRSFFKFCGVKLKNQKIQDILQVHTVNSKNP